MKILNFLEIRTLVRSNRIGIDINSNLYNHPRYKKVDIGLIDSRITNYSFSEKFVELVSVSLHDNRITDLLSLSSIKVRCILHPKRPYTNNRNTSGLKWLFNDIRNHFAQTPYVTIKPNETFAIPLSITISEKTNVPLSRISLSDELADLGLVSLNVIPAANGQKYSYAVLFNSSRSNVTIKDLAYIGELQILNG